jgi:hypothetical protein
MSIGPLASEPDPEKSSINPLTASITPTTSIMMEMILFDADTSFPIPYSLLKNYGQWHETAARLFFIGSVNIFVMN